MGGIMDKEQALREYLKNLGSVVVAFSGGVDSTFLLQMAVDVLGQKNVVAANATACFIPEKETAEAKAFCQSRKIAYKTFSVDVMKINGMENNPANRCYLCKKKICDGLFKIARECGITAVVEGSNLDDEGDYRPGMMAVEEMGVLSPLRETSWKKEEIRIASRKMNLPTADKPANACLASRFVYGQPLTEERLRMVDEAEQFLHDLGIGQCRVRIHGQGRESMARIEVEAEDFACVLAGDNAKAIHNKCKEIGFSYVTLDLGGFCSGNMNRTIDCV